MFVKATTFKTGPLATGSTRPARGSSFLMLQPLLLLPPLLLLWKEHPPDGGEGPELEEVEGGVFVRYLGLGLDLGGAWLFAREFGRDPELFRGRLPVKRRKGLLFLIRRLVGLAV